MTDSPDTVVTQPSLGERLRVAREARGLSLREMADKLCLLAPCVQAMEENDYGYFRAAIFAKGYLRNYVRQLGLDEQRAMREYEELAKALPPEKDADFFVGGQRTAVKPNRNKYWLFAAAGVLILAGMIFWVTRAEEPVVEPVAVESPDLTMVVDPLVGSSVLVSDQQLVRMDPLSLPAVVINKNQNNKPQAVVARPLFDQISLAFAGDCWIKVIDSNGEVLVSAMKHANDTVTLKGKAPFNIVIGNAPVVSLSYNGEPVSIETIDENYSAKIIVGES
jgi:cytoskeleton protein RodZ